MPNYTSLINLWQVIANYSKLQQSYSKFWQVIASSSKFWECLLDSTKVYKKTMYMRVYIRTHQLLKTLII